ncbi:MAG: TolC family protein [Bacteroidia bacterium]|jgi:NodT family efflux transporter outer membrane factor (OMF) lipoprotein|nr:TolC family protein [Bacteroidia bacterium]
MKTKNIRSLFTAVILLLIVSCKILRNNVSIPEKKLPSTFNQSNDSISIANIKWREFFADSNLITLIDIALQNNADIQIALQQIEAYKSQVKMAKAAQLPTINSNANFSQRKFGFYTMDDAGNRVTEIAPGDTIPTHLPDYFVGLTTAWEIDVWGKIKNQKKSVVSSYLASVEGRNFVVSTLIAEICKLYYELLSLDNEILIIRQTIAKQQEALSVISFQKEVGRSTDLAVQQFQSQLISSQIMEYELLQQINMVENNLNLLMGRYPQKIVRSNEDLFNPLPSVIKVGIPSMMLTNRPDIKEAEHLLNASKFNFKASKALFLPSFNINATLGLQSYASAFLFTTPQSIMYSALSGITAPIINRRAIKAQFSQATANQLAAMYNYQKIVLNSFLEVAGELSNIENLQQIHTLTKQQAEVLKQSVETAVELYKSAKAGYLEVLFSQQNSLQTQLEFINIQKRQRIAIVNIYKALGGGWQ